MRIFGTKSVWMTIFMLLCVAYEKSRACFLSVWSTEMGARLLSGGLSSEADWGRGGLAVMLSLTPKSQVTGDPGLEIMLADTCWITSRWRVGLSGFLEVILIGPICLIRCRLSTLSGINFGSSGAASSSSSKGESYTTPLVADVSSSLVPLTSSALILGTVGGGVSRAAWLASKPISPFFACNLKMIHWIFDNKMRRPFLASLSCCRS